MLKDTRDLRDFVEKWVKAVDEASTDSHYLNMLEIYFEDKDYYNETIEKMNKEIVENEYDAFDITKIMG